MNETFERMPLLEKILKQCPELHIVVSSSWRETMTLEGLKYLFPVAFRHRIIGVTPSLQEVKDTKYVRYRECLLHARHMGVNKLLSLMMNHTVFHLGAKIWCQRITVRG
uniref:HAD domain-containing protein n=1 Tax=Klebsiella pneumoniae TaxID=573 RepID=UPI002017197B|nr:HAD domain-containing protein [Klebsiella pneumoniae]